MHIHVYADQLFRSNKNYYEPFKMEGNDKFHKMDVRVWA